ncbi:MAG TPA: YqaJ viral recombinase family protein [Novosphingobium sp.]
MNEFDVIQLAQGTDEWRKWRASGIGASDASVIMGENPWKSVEDLRFEKHNPQFAARLNSAMARGTILEPIARDAYCLRKKFEVRPLCIQSKEFPWMRCSLDGICLERMHLVEIKCGEKAHKHTARYRSPPRHYYGQLQHAIAVTQSKAIDFWCYLPDRQPILTTIPRNDWYIERLISRELEFWDSIKDYVAN